MTVRSAAREVYQRGPISRRKVRPGQSPADYSRPPADPATFRAIRWCVCCDSTITAERRGSDFCPDHAPAVKAEVRSLKNLADRPSAMVSTDNLRSLHDLVAQLAVARTSVIGAIRAADQPDELKEMTRIAGRVIYMVDRDFPSPPPP